MPTQLGSYELLSDPYLARSYPICELYSFVRQSQAASYCLFAYGVTDI